MSLDRVACLEAFRRAVELCDPERLVAGAKAGVLGGLIDRPQYGLALGKAALKMARGFGPVARGVIVTNADDGLGVPDGWHVMIGAHPEPDARSLAAGEAVIDLIAGATSADAVVALISGGASSLVEWPAPGVTLDELRARVAACMASGADIHALNQLRRELSAIKGGKLARLSEAHVATLAISDVYDDDLATIGSGPTIGHRLGDRASVIAPMRLFVDTLEAELGDFDRVAGPLRGSVEQVAGELIEAWNRHGGELRMSHRHARAFTMRGPRRGRRLGWGEPTVALPEDHGEGGRAQQLALELARELSGTWPASAMVVGSDGIDGPAPAHRPSPAGAFIEHTTWDAIAAAGIDPERALARCDAGTALDAIGALIVTGPTGINFGDVMLVG
ncbi:MAG TPA: DUF4147 domain-containing protein [Kofleriaceae bacterium]|jgi:hydroxypyruvate reductase